MSEMRLGQGGGGRVEEQFVAGLHGQRERRVAQEVDGVGLGIGGGHVGVVADPCRQIGCRVGKWVGTEQRADAGLLRYELVGLGVAEATGAVLLIGDEERIGQHVVYPCRHCRMPGGVGTIAFGATPNPTIRAVNSRNGGLDLGDRSVGGLGDIQRGPRQPAQRIVAIARVVFDTGDHLGMGGLHEQGPDPADECGRVADDAPRDRVGAEEARVGGVVEGVLEWTRAM